MAVEDAAQVDVDDLLPAVEGIVADRFQRPRDARVVDQQMQRAGAFDGGRDHLLDLFRVGDIAFMRMGLAACACDRLRHGLGMAPVQVGHDDGRARGGEFLRDGLADARAGAGDDGGLAVEADIHDALQVLRCFT